VVLEPSSLKIGNGDLAEVTFLLPQGLLLGLKKDSDIFVTFKTVPVTK